jgi:hypothetical protein
MTGPGPRPCQAPGVNPDWWFPARGDWLTAERARRLCAACPLQAGCLAGALARNEWFGIWGGLTAAERRRLPRQHPCRRCGEPTPVRLQFCGDLCRTAARRQTQRASARRKAVA